MSNAHDDFAFEPVPGLPALLPEGEHLVWQGAPDPWSFAIAVMRLKAVAGIVLVLAIWRAMAAIHDGLGGMGAASTVASTLFSGIAVLGLLATVGHLMARGTIYSITSHRLIIRHGVAMPMAINIPFSRVAAAAADPSPPGVQGGGSIALTMDPESRASLIALWPHARPFKLRRPEPALRGLADGARVASIIADALRASRPAAPTVGSTQAVTAFASTPPRGLEQPAEAA